MSNKKNIYNSKEGGYTALFAVILFTLFFMLLFSSVVNSSIAVMSRTTDQEKGFTARAAASSCLEQILANFREDTNYLIEEGEVAIALSVEGECVAQVVEVNENEYLFSITTNYQQYYHNLEATVGVVIEEGFRYLKIQQWREN